MKTVIILTQPRSGSSVLAGILHKLGVSMGDNEEELIATSHDNKYGSYEDQDFQVLHHRMLFKANILIRYPNRLKEDESRIEKAVKIYEDKLVSLIHKKERELWGWKDAVIIYTIPYFEQHLKNPYYIFLKRPPESVANSQIQAGRYGRWWKEIKLEYSYQPLHRWIPLALRTFGVILRHGFIWHKIEYLSKIVENAHQRIKNFTKNKKCIQIDLDSLINSSEEEINRIIEFLEISPTEDQIKEAFNFVHPELIKSDVHK
ncbi:MAG: sulfotransferase [Candidatus Heimdallarchaeota archaeon]|nr:sulfotransferase [Candidatus Heimdallarchaeota archaeon]MCK4877488.1 sulfotransferase [Candidatus Heimdallarchaeota archaeon]